MVIVYETSGCSSCRYAKAWLERHGVEYKSKNMQQSSMTKKELKHLFSLALDIYDLLSVRSIAIRDFKKIHGRDIEDLSFNELMDFLQKNPTALRRPIITDGKRLVVGWDEEEMTVFRNRK